MIDSTCSITVRMARARQLVLVTHGSLRTGDHGDGDRSFVGAHVVAPMSTPVSNAVGVGFAGHRLCV